MFTVLRIYVTLNSPQLCPTHLPERNRNEQLLPVFAGMPVRVRKFANACYFVCVCVGGVSVGLLTVCVQVKIILADEEHSCLLQVVSVRLAWKNIFFSSTIPLKCNVILSLCKDVWILNKKKKH